jgi:gliding motility-associated-like protein
MFIPYTGIGISKIITMRIFDRWGNVVFANNDFAPNDEKMGWDGTLKGSKVNPAVFTYYIQVQLSDGKIQTVSGDVTLMR